MTTDADVWKENRKLRQRAATTPVASEARMAVAKMENAERDALHHEARAKAAIGERRTILDAALADADRIRAEANAYATKTRQEADAHRESARDALIEARSIAATIAAKEADEIHQRHARMHNQTRDEWRRALQEWKEIR